MPTLRDSVGRNGFTLWSCIVGSIQRPGARLTAAQLQVVNDLWPKVGRGLSEQLGAY
jgi:hypothetical protein